MTFADPTQHSDDKKPNSKRTRLTPATIRTTARSRHRPHTREPNRDKADGRLASPVLIHHEAATERLRVEHSTPANPLIARPRSCSPRR
ncbi:hypothetical protein [Paraburkholderia antibiotica]|uniref:hypothetical protein n=1 Tax=Paraburkholderia antibiotica TaxID=2728839 RepID=UPI001981774D|nr:hypothetical protein [Paraburkholderia antibiotica]